jgi:hypothetical protein
MNRLLALLLLVAACGKSEHHAPPTPTKTPAPALAHATQADLAQEIAEADRLGTWREVQRRWQGQTLRWTVTRQRVLCGSADDCNVAAFPIQRPAKQGWLPGLSFAAGQYDALARACGNQDQCEVTIEGTLSELEVSPELPTRVQISNVRLVSAPAGHVQTAHS